MRHTSELSKANATAAAHIQQHGPLRTEHCRECGKDYQTTVRFAVLCPTCDATDKQQHEAGYRGAGYRRDAFGEQRRARGATSLEVARAEVVGCHCLTCDRELVEGEKVIVDRDYTGNEQRVTVRARHATCPND